MKEIHVITCSLVELGPKDTGLVICYMVVSHVVICFIVVSHGVMKSSHFDVFLQT